MPPPKIYHKGNEVTHLWCPIHEEEIEINDCWYCSGNKGILSDGEIITVDCSPNGGRIEFGGEASS